MLLVLHNFTIAVLTDRIPAAGSSHSPNRCPWSDPRVVHAATPAVPEKRRKAGTATGEVEVKVSLDARSHIVLVEVYKSTNASLNRYAIETTERSTFQTEIRDCKPVPASYRFVVEFE